MRKKIPIAVTIILAVGLLITGCQSSCPEIGSTAPDFTLETVDGKTISLKDYHGKTVMLNFWATWCGPCVAEMPHLQEVHDKRSGQGTILLSIDVGENASKVSEFIDKNGYTFTVLLDSQAKVAELYCLPQALPQTLFINSDGIFKARKIGAFQSIDEIYSLLDSL